MSVELPDGYWHTTFRLALDEIAALISPRDQAQTPPVPEGYALQARGDGRDGAEGRTLVAIAR